ncbi:MAG: ribonuclease protein component [Chitinophagaceae bacterium]|nr:ribonuclease protein component [Chitinophagaceae bacterium]
MTQHLYTYGKKEKLKSRKKIDQLFQEGKTFSVFPLKVWYLFSAEENSTVQAGVGASKRFFKKAVDRNRIKRILREAYRHQKNILLDDSNCKTKAINIFFLYTGKELPSSNLYAEMQKALQKIIAANETA